MAATCADPIACRSLLKRLCPDRSVTRQLAPAPVVDDGAGQGAIILERGRLFEITAATARISAVDILLQRRARAHNDRNRIAFRAQQREHAEPVEFRHLYVEDDEIRLFDADAIERDYRFGFPGHMHATLSREGECHEFQAPWIVI